jgi:non-ribosomal peptide synthetase component F
MDVLSRDVFSYYESYRDNKPTGLKDLRIQYKDYSSWQLNSFGKGTTSVHKDYWLEILSGPLPLLELPFMNKRPQFKNFTGGIWSTYIDDNLSFSLRTRCRENEGTLFHGILTSWLILMHKYSNKNDLIIGTSVTGRNHPDLNDQIGFYSNSIALRNKINPNDNFTEMLKIVIANSNRAMEHQDYPFIQLVNDLELKRDGSRNPVFDSMLVFNSVDNKANSQNLAHLNYNEISHMQSSAKFDLEISIIDLGPIISFSIIYDSEVFDSLKVKSMIVDYKLLLNELLDKPNMEIKNIKVDDQVRKDIKKINLSKLTSKKI